MNTSFEKLKFSSDEWYTPPEIIKALGVFDLDPCSAINPLWPTAKYSYNKYDDGLSKNWAGRVWLNPPYSRPLMWQFVSKLAEHNNGIALLFNRADSKAFHQYVFNMGDAIMFLKNRIRFYRPDGSIGTSPGCGSVLVAYGRENAIALKNSNIHGKYIDLKLQL